MSLSLIAIPPSTAGFLILPVPARGELKLWTSEYLILRTVFTDLSFPLGVAVENREDNRSVKFEPGLGDEKRAFEVADWAKSFQRIQ